MPDIHEIHPATDAVKALAGFIHDSDIAALTPEQIDVELKHAGINSDSTMKRFLSSLEAAEGRAELNAAAQTRRSWTQRFVEFAAQLPRVANPREKVRELLESTFGGKPEYSVAFRKFEDAPDDDLASLLVELQFLNEVENDTDESGS